MADTEHYIGENGLTLCGKPMNLAGTSIDKPDLDRLIEAGNVEAGNVEVCQECADAQAKDNEA